MDAVGAVSHRLCIAHARRFLPSKQGGRTQVRPQRPRRRPAAAEGRSVQRSPGAAACPSRLRSKAAPRRRWSVQDHHARSGRARVQRANEEREGSVQRPPRGKHWGAPALQGMTGRRPGGPCQQGDHFQRRRVSRLPCNGNGDPRGGVEPSISPSAPRGGNARARWPWWKRLLINDRERARKGPAMLASRAAASTDYRRRRLAVAVEVVALGVWGCWAGDYGGPEGGARAEGRRSLRRDLPPRAGIEPTTRIGPQGPSPLAA